MTTTVNVTAHMAPVAESVESNRRTARLAGLFYFAMLPLGLFGMLYVPSQLFVDGDTAATVQNIVDNELLFRSGIASALVVQVLFVFVAVYLYKLFNSVHLGAARLMVLLIAVSIPIAMLNEVNHLAILEIVGNGGSLDQVQLFDEMHTAGVAIASIFWGLWLAPLGYLSYKSGFIPRLIGVLLYIGCVSYVVDAFGYLLNPDLEFSLSQFLALGEVVMIAWLLIKGVSYRTTAGQQADTTGPA